jgi:hypothetical protein
MHVNSVDYNTELDQIMLSVHSFHEVWVIDHSTTSEQAASHQGGRSGKGGDLLYRWGNPRAYRNGTRLEQRLFAQHDAHWIPQGLPGAGHMLVFNNGSNRPDGNYSSVDEVVLPVDAHGNYAREEYLPFGPERAAWSYSAPDKSSFFSMLISGAHRLPNGNTFICSGIPGILFEVTPEKEVVWEYHHPNKMGGNPIPFAGHGRFSLIPDFLQGVLRLNDDQRRALTEVDADVKKQVDDLLSEEQLQALAKPISPFGGPGGFRPPRPGTVLPEAVRDELALTAAQARKLATIQDEVDRTIAAILNDQQNKQLEQLASLARSPGFGRSGAGRDGGPRPGPSGFGPPPGPGGRRGGGPPPGFPPGGGFPPSGFGRPDRGNPSGLGGGPPPGFGPPGFGPPGGGGPGGPPGGGGLFRSYRYGPDFPGLQGKELTPGERLEDLVAKSSGE